MKQFGISKPRSFDYFLSFTFAIIALASVLVGFWVAFGKGWDYSLDAIDLSIRALTGAFAGTHSLAVAIMSGIFYVGALVSLIFFLMSIFKRDARALAGICALLLCVTAFSCQIGFVVVFSSVVNGLFTSFLAFFMLLEIILTILNVRLLCHRLIVDNKYYDEYILDFPEAEYIEDNSGEFGKELNQDVAEEILEEKLAEQPLEKKEEPEEQPVEEPQEEEIEEPQEEIEPQEETEEPQEEIAEQDTEEAESNEDEGEEGEDNEFANLHARLLTFDEKLQKAKPIARERFEEIKAHFESLGFNSMRTKHAELFMYKNNKYAQIMMSGTSGLKIYYKLNASDYEGTTIPVSNVEHIKKYEKTPLLFSVKSDLSVKRAKKLMEDVKNNIENDISK